MEEDFLRITFSSWLKRHWGRNRFFSAAIGRMYLFIYLLKAYGEWCWIRDLRRRRFSLGTRNQAWSLKRFLCQFSSVQSLSRVWLSVTPWTAACQASLLITNSRSLLKFKSIEWVMPSNHLKLYPPLPFLPSIFPSIRVFTNEPFLHIRWPVYWSDSFSISPPNEYSGLISFRMD